MTTTPLFQLLGPATYVESSYRKMQAADWTDIKLLVEGGFSTDSINQTIEKFLARVLLDLGPSNCSSGWEAAITPFLNFGGGGVFSPFGWITDNQSRIGDFAAEPSTYTLVYSISTSSVLAPRAVNIGPFTTGEGTEYLYAINWDSMATGDDRSVFGFALLDADSTVAQMLSNQGVTTNISPIYKIAAVSEEFCETVAQPVIALMIKAQDFAGGGIYTGGTSSVLMQGEIVSIPTIILNSLRSAPPGTTMPFEEITPPVIPPVVPPTPVIPPGLLIPAEVETPSTDTSKSITGVVIAVISIVGVFFFLGFVAILMLIIYAVRSTSF